MQTSAPHSVEMGLYCRLNNRTQQLNTVATAQHRGFTLAPAVDWKTGNKGVSLSHKFRAGTLKGSYAHDRQLAALNYDFQPFNVPPPPAQFTEAGCWVLSKELLGAASFAL